MSSVMYNKTWENEYRLFGEPPCEIGDVIDIGGKNVVIKDVEPFYYEYRVRDPSGVEIGFSTGTYSIDTLRPPSDQAFVINHVGIQRAGATSIRIRFRYPREVNLFTNSADLSLISSVIAPYDSPIRLPMIIRDIQALNVVVEAPAPGTMDAIWFYGYIIRFDPADTGKIPTKKLPHRRVNSYK